MKVKTKVLAEYETPQVTTIEIVVEQSVLAGSSNLDHMTETEGEWV